MPLCGSATRTWQWWAIVLQVPIVLAVTILPGGQPKPYAGAAGVSSAYDFFTQSAANEFGNRTVEIFMSNRDSQDYYTQDHYQVLPSADSFVRGALQAWGEHLHLVLAPDEVWLAVLAQINFYVNANPAEAARHAFDLRANDTIAIAMFPDWYVIVEAFYSAVGARARTDWLQRFWISPNFTTSTDDHVVAAHVLMLAQTRSFLQSPLPSAGRALLCGLPSVTLLGTRADWETIVWRVQQMAIFGPEPAAYAARLLPVVRRFVGSFDTPDDLAIRAFWNQIVVATPPPSMAATQSSTAPYSRPPLAGCSGTSNGPSFSISGWITAFYYWDAAGQPYGRTSPRPGPASSSLPTAATMLDNVTYATVDLRTLPVSYSRTSFTLSRWNDTDNYQVLATAGPMGKRVDAGAPAGYIEALNRTRHAGVPPWVESNDTSETNSNTQTWSQWARDGFGIDAKAHGTLTPLTSWVFYGPAVALNATATRWLPEPELGAVAAALLSHYNASSTPQCFESAAVPTKRLATAGGPASARRNWYRQDRRRG